jgi:hypothetical protein
MRRQHGGHVGTGDSFTLGADELARVPEVLLVAMGEREEDVPRMISRWRSMRTSGVAESRGGRRRRTSGCS